MKTYVPKDLYEVQSSFIHHPKLEKVMMHQEDTGWKKKKKKIVYSYNGLQLRNEKQWTTNIHNNVDESQNILNRRSLVQKNTYCITPSILSSIAF